MKETSALIDVGSDEDEEDEAGEEDEEPVQTVVSFLDETTFPEVHSMLRYTTEKYGLDLVSIQKDLRLDFLNTIKLVNYIRTQAKNGRGGSLDLSDPSVFSSDEYLKPVIEGDPLLYSLEEVFGTDLYGGEEEDAGENVEPTSADLDSEGIKIAELQKALFEVRQTLKATQQRLDLTTRALDAQIDSEDSDDERSSRRPIHVKEEKSAYEGNYDGHTLHRSMLSDQIRTNAYRDFILGNKHLFQNKSVLDVGCGTGILSLFCAEAGAKRVYAVDQSSIINCARENVFRAGKQDVIEFFHGKLEDVALPIPPNSIDVLISEWMGYCLLFEGMALPLIYARDRHLSRETGLMVPSHASLYLAPFNHPEYTKDRIHYWDDVYGYDMSSMRSMLYIEIDTDTTLPQEHLLAPAQPFLELDMHTVKSDDLVFSGCTFEFILPHPDLKADSEDSEQSEETKSGPTLDGFAIWFDISFHPARASRPSAPPSSTKSQQASPPPPPEFTTVTFTTGPHGPETHWHQGLCLIDRNDMPPRSTTEHQNTRTDSQTAAAETKKTTIVRGMIGYSSEDASAGTGEKVTEGGLDVTIAWKIVDVDVDVDELEPESEAGRRESVVREKGKQTWSLH